MKAGIQNQFDNTLVSYVVFPLMAILPASHNLGSPGESYDTTECDGSEDTGHPDCAVFTFDTKFWKAKASPP